MSIAAPQSEAPDLALRAKPPSPKRLSRKVLMTGVGLAGVLIAFALINGLSERPGRHSSDSQAAVAAAGGAPETITQAASQYDIADLPRADLEAPSFDAPGPQLAPPPDEAWASQPNAAGASPGGRQSASADPQQAPGHASPILFSERADTGHGERDQDRLATELRPPSSPYVLQAGQVIPAALITALNSDSPGRVIASVTSPIYDSVAGAHLLIPQGSRLLGTYKSGVAHGDDRIELVWDRLILPSGWSIALQAMEATDPSGAAGLHDSTDNHLGRLAMASLFSSVIGVGANEAQSDNEQGFGQSLGDAAAQQAAQTGARIIDRELTVHPTLRVRAGAPVRVLVSRDIVLRPQSEAESLP